MGAKSHVPQDCISPKGTLLLVLPASSHPTSLVFAPRSCGQHQPYAPPHRECDVFTRLWALHIWPLRAAPAELYLEGVENPNTYIHGEYLTGKHVQSIAACCQGGCLRKLSLLAVLGGEVNYGVLSTLTTLTHLSLKEVGTRGLHQLVSLEELCLEYASLAGCRMTHWLALHGS